MVEEGKPEVHVIEPERGNKRAGRRDRDRGSATFGQIDIRATLIAGVIAGIVFLILEMALIPLLGVSVWAPIQMMAAILLGAEVLPPPATFTIGVFLAAMVVHFALSIIYAFIVAALVQGRTVGRAIMVGIAFGLGLFLVNFFVFTGFFPWFADGRHWVNVVAHLAFGGVAGWVYLKAAVTEPGRRALREQPA